MDIEKFHERLQRLHLPSYTPVNHPHKVDYILDYIKEPHDMVDHEVHSFFHVLEEYVDNLDDNKALDLSQRKLELFPGYILFYMEE